jgi:sigma-54 dependent transcriptional regulator, flagellar regulatory protein
MALPYILLVDDNKTRSQHLETILQFMEYRVKTADSSNYDASTSELDQLFGVFVAHDLTNHAAIIKDIVNKPGKIPVVLLIDKGASPRDPAALDDDVFQALECPATYPALKRITDKISSTTDAQNSNQAQQTQGSQEEGLAERRRGFTDRRGYDRRFSAQDRLKGNSQAIVDIRKSIAQVAKTDANVLILGESGTGKEIIARAVHDASLRRPKLFVPINCGAIPAELLESELFGHEKGAFTGALGVRQGRFEMAEGGTLFLDEIGDMPMPMQVKLLRVLQERTFERVGSNKTMHCDVRVIAATHRHLSDEIKANRFREDLFYRLNVFPIEVTALRDRIEDLPLLVEDIISCMESANRSSVQFTKAALNALMQYEWPGNIRELANLIERMAIIYPNERVDVANLPEKFQQYKVLGEIRIPAQTVDSDDIAELLEKVDVNDAIDGSPALAQLPTEGIDLKEYLNVLEGDLIRQALIECSGVVAHAAKRLNMRRTTLVEKLRKYDLER